MDRASLENLLAAVAAGRLSVQDALDQLRNFPDHELPYATLDTHRLLRQGHLEFVYGLGKTASQIAGIVETLSAHGRPILVTRVDEVKATEVLTRVAMQYHPEARALTRFEDRTESLPGNVCVVTAGTSDRPVGEEAALTLRLLGIQVTRVEDVGVAGLHRLLNRMPQIRGASVVIVAAGMEGALPSVIGGLIDRPVIAVPTSAGYGVGAGGLAALAGMLSSCASGLTVVNIDNGFGAAYAAYRILRLKADA